MSEPAFDFRRLTLAERLQLVEDIWDSIAEESQASPAALSLSAAQRQEIQRRRAAHQQDPGAAIAWDQVRDEFLGRGG